VAGQAALGANIGGANYEDYAGAQGALTTAPPWAERLKPQPSVPQTEGGLSQLQTA